MSGSPGVVVMRTHERERARVRASNATAAVLVIAGLVVSAMMSFRWTYDPDLWWHLAQGREIAAGHLPRSNLFSFTHPEWRQPATSWLFDLGVYGLWQLGGASAIQLAQAGAIFLTATLLYAACRLRAGIAASAAIVTFGCFVLELRALPRPHTLSFVGMAACALVIERALASRSARPLFAAVPLLLVWSNVHVESLFGLVFLACFAGGTLLAPRDVPRALGWRALAVVVASGGATLLNPYGLGLGRYLVENAHVPDVLRIAELQPPYLPNYAAFYIYLLALSVLLLWRPRPRAFEVLAAGWFAFLALRHLRFTPLLVCATAPVAAARLEARVGDRRLVPLGALVLGLLVARLDPVTFVRQLGVGLDALAPSDIMPRGAVAFVERVGLHGRVFNSNNIGGYLIWTLYPRVRVFQDGRLQAYPMAHFVEIVNASRSQDRWNDLVAGVDWAMLSVPRPNALSGAGRFPARDWATVYFDEAAEVLVRRRGMFAELVPELEYRTLRPGFDPFAPVPAWREDAERMVSEVRRNGRDDPTAFAPAAWLCLHDDAGACSAAFAIAAAHPDLRRAALRLERRRAGAPSANDEDAEPAASDEQ